MGVAIVVPWRGGCPFRQKAFDYVTHRYKSMHLSWPVIVGESSEGPFNRMAAILDAARKTTADTLVVTDADVFLDGPLDAAVAGADAAGWAVPHRLLHRLSAESTYDVIHGADWRGLPLSIDNRQDKRPYKGNETGTLFVIRRDVLDDVPPDVRFVGWGQEDEAYGDALRTLVGPAWRGDAHLVHLWHPPAQRQSRRIGSAASLELRRRYSKAKSNPQRMRQLVEEARKAAA